MAWNCKFNFTNGNYKKVSEEVKEVLGGEYNGAVFKTLAIHRLLPAPWPDGWNVQKL